MELYVLIALAALCVGLAAYIAVMKLQMRALRRALHRNLDPSYDRQLSVSLLDPSLNSLAAEVNNILDDQRRLKRDAVRAEGNLKQSVSDIAHDLRTPMTVIKGNLQLLSQDEHLSPRGCEYLATCSEKADKLKEMADAFFELSVLESDDTAAELRQVNLTKTLMQFLADSEAAIRLHGLEPQIVFPEKTAFICADEQMLVRMLGNVLNNILKYAHDSFRLEVAAGKDSTAVAFSNPVRAGEMPDTSLMFERSYRADASRSGGSAGLGLFIVRLLAEKQGAKVSASAKENVLTLLLEFPNN
ncbi:Signal transduction histidine kinase [Ruminococcus sp. YRD2003]|uniref:sensor histidine kinase n=1 Tax=Ruminococcus sp. YRD2003 TaxID=1452313 RepID=UPI0008BA5913|nr:HAMP domain-containing histidine kinase [Ruminococcus sp.]SEK43936.1 Signal transduction histidine kinase [Ruminococcus flavefaciens]